MEILHTALTVNRGGTYHNHDEKKAFNNESKAC